MKIFDLMIELDEIDFDDQSAILDWLCRYQEQSDYIGLEKPWKEIVTKFFRHGYFPNVNCHDDLKEDDKDSVARYIIGQSLHGLRSEFHSIRQVIHGFVEKWNNRFNPTPKLDAVV